MQPNKKAETALPKVDKISMFNKKGLLIRKPF